MPAPLDSVTQNEIKTSAAYNSLEWFSPELLSAELRWFSAGCDYAERKLALDKARNALDRLTRYQECEKRTKDFRIEYRKKPKAPGWSIHAQPLARFVSDPQRKPRPPGYGRALPQLNAKN